MRSNTSPINAWRAEAEALGDVKNPLVVPFDVFLREASTAAQFLERRWEP